MKFWKKIILIDKDDNPLYGNTQIADTLNTYFETHFKDIINPYNSLLITANFSVNTTNEYTTSYIIK